MTDPLSVTFGVIGTAAVALRSVQRLKSFIDSIDGAPSAINSLLTDLNALNNVLRTLETTLKDSTFAGFDAQARVLRLLDEPLRNCVGVVDLMSEKLNASVKPGSKLNRSRWRAFFWTYREKEFTDLKSLLLSYKSSLDIALSAATLIHNAAGLSDLHARIKNLHHRIDVDNASIADSSLGGSSTAQTDYNYALKRFLLDTETIFNDEPAIPREHSSVAWREDSPLLRAPSSSSEYSQTLRYLGPQESLGEVRAEIWYIQILLLGFLDIVIPRPTHLILYIDPAKL